LPPWLPVAVRVLRDTKHVAKDYWAAPCPPGDAALGWREVALTFDEMAVMRGVPRIPGDHATDPHAAWTPAPTAAGVDLGVRQARVGIEMDMPPVAALLRESPDGAKGVGAAPTTTMTGERACEVVARAFAETYRMCSDLVVADVRSASRTRPGAARGLDLFGSAGASIALDPAQRLVAEADSGLEGRGAWRHAGGVEDWKVACPCGARDDDGERMQACSKCDCWSHTRCLGVDDRDPPPPSFICKGCKAALNRGG